MKIDRRMKIFFANALSFLFSTLLYSHNFCKLYFAQKVSATYEEEKLTGTYRSGFGIAEEVKDPPRPECTILAYEKQHQRNPHERGKTSIFRHENCERKSSESSVEI